MSLEQITFGSRPAYWSVTFVDSDGIQHIGVNEGEYTVFLGSMVQATAPTSQAGMSGLTYLDGSLFQVTSEQAQFY